MPITVDDLDVAGDLSLSTLRRAAMDQLQDKGDAKGERRAERVVNQALKWLASEKRWNWYLRLWTLVLRPKTTLTSRCSMAVDGQTITLTTGTWPSNAATRSFRFSGDTTILRIKTRNSSTVVTTFSNEVFVGSAAKTSQTGFLIYDRFELPENFKVMVGVPQEKDYYDGLTWVTPEEWLFWRQSNANNESAPTYFTLWKNHHTQRTEIWFWPTPTELRECSFWMYVSPLDLVNDNDVADWDPALSYALYAAIDLLASRELQDAKRYPMAERAYRDAVLRAKQHDADIIRDEPASGGPRERGSKIQRSTADIVDS